MLVTRHQTITVQGFVDLHRHRRLNLAPAFQRQSVWSATDRQLLIQSILDGIPLPSIYLYRQVGKGGVPMYDVIDGKQRLETILLFLGKGPLACDQHLWIRASFDEDEPLDWWSWRDLRRPIRNQILTTEIPSIEVEGELGEIIELFVRINATGKRLTGQEKRNARFYANPVLKAAQRLADELKPTLVRQEVVNQGQVQRMKHVELVTELLLAINAGQPLNKKSKIDEIIRGAALESKELRDAGVQLRRAVKLVVAVLPDLKTTRFRNGSDYYSLALLLHRYREEGKAITAHDSARNALAGALLRDFARGVDEVNDQMRFGKGIQTYQEPFRDYLMTVRADTDSFKQRMTRERLLRDVLDGVFDERDPNRLYNATQRRVVWHASRAKKCSLCKMPIKRWEEMSIDHVTPHSRGGRTILTNAKLAHRRCNSAAGAKWGARKAG
jgi:hypothetical protein